MRTLIGRWRAMSDAEIDRLGQNIIAFHWFMMGGAILGWVLLPHLLGVSPEVVSLTGFLRL